MPPPPQARPSRADLEAARARRVPDLLGDRPALLVCGINPGLWSGWSGHHFAGPGNRLWPALERAGITPRRLRPHETDDLVGCGVGITNLVHRTTARADEVGRDELRAGAARLEDLVARVRPGAVVVLGMGAYRTAFARPRAGLGRQDEAVGGRPLWVAPNPSGLQARYGLPEIAAVLAAAHAEGLRALGGGGGAAEGAA